MPDSGEVLHPPTTIAEAAEEDPIGSRYVELVARAHERYGDRAYIVDYPPPGTFAPEIIHPRLAPDLASSGSVEQLRLQLKILEDQIPPSGERGRALMMRVRGLGALIDSIENPNHIQPSDVAKIAYGFDPKELPKMTTAEHEQYSQEVLHEIPPELRPTHPTPKSINEARILLTNSLRVHSLAEGDDLTRETFFKTAAGLLRDQARAVGLLLPESEIKAVLTANESADFFLLFNPEHPVTYAFVNKKPELHPLPAQVASLLAHEDGHLIHLRRMFDNAIRQGRTEDAIFPLGPQAVSEGIADATVRILFPDAESFYATAVALYQLTGNAVNEAHLKHVCETTYGAPDDPKRLTLGERIDWEAYLRHEQDTLQYGQDEADKRFITDYQKSRFTNRDFAERRLKIVKYYGPYVYVGAFYRAWVARQLDGVEDKAGKLLELCDTLPTAVGSVKDYV